MGQALCNAERFFCGETLTSMVQWEPEISAQKGYEITVVNSPDFYYHFTTTACRNLLHFALFREICDRVKAVTPRKQVG